MIELKDASFRYGKTPLLENLSCRMADGEITALLGPNGSGKSTLLKLCARLLAPQTGMVLVNAQPAQTYDSRAFARTLAYLPQSRPTPMISVRALVSHGRFPHLGMSRRLTAQDEAAVDRALEMTGIADLARRELRTLSGGQRQKAYIAMLIAQEAQHILLDEPTVYLDLLHQMELMEILHALRNEGHCIAVVMHDLAQAMETCDHALLLHDGQPVYDGNMRDLSDSGAIETAFGIRMKPNSGIAFEKIR